MFDFSDEYEQKIEKRYYSVKELAKMGFASESTIWRRIHSGELKAVKCGQSVRITIDALREYEQAHLMVQ